MISEDLFSLLTVVSFIRHCIGRSQMLLWSIFSAPTTLSTLSPRAKCRSNPTTRRPGLPALQWLQHQLFASFGFSHAPTLLPSCHDKAGDKGFQKCRKLRHTFFRNCVALWQNCVIHHRSVKMHHLFIITWRELNSWRIAGVDPCTAASIQIVEDLMNQFAV